MQLDSVQIDFTESENVWYIVILNVDMFIALGNCLIFAGIDCPLVVRILFGFVCRSRKNLLQVVISRLLLSQQSMTR